MINVWRKKILVAKYITLKVKEGKMTVEILEIINQNQKNNIQIKCFNCNNGLELLPALQFHHIDKRLKIQGAGWNDLRFKSLKFIINKIDQQECILLCANCHAMRTATFFEQYKDIIFSEETEEFNWRIRGKINRWIRKKKIIEDLFNGKCTKCQKISIKNLPSLQIHHLDPSQKRFNYSTDLRDITDTSKIKKLLLDERCTCLCSNCHSIEGAEIFNKYKNKIIQFNF